MDTLAYISLVYDKFIIFSLILARISTLLTTFVLFRRDLITRRVILPLAVILSVYVMLSDSTKEMTYSFFSFQMLTQLIFQTFIGFIAGLILNIVFDVFIAIGQIISVEIGLGMTSLLDPRFGIITSLTQFYIISASLIFLFLNGHLFIIKTITESFNVLPLDKSNLSQLMLADILTYASIIFSGSIIIALAVVVTILLTNVAFALVTKFAPQFNIFSIGLNMTLIMGLIIAFLTYGIFVNEGIPLMQQGLDTMLKLFTVKING